MNFEFIGQEARYIVDTGDRQYIQINEASAAITEPVLATEDSIETINKQNEDNNFWDRSKIKLFLTLCLENNYKNTSNSKDKGLLQDIASHIGTTPDNCSNKYKNLRRTFIRLLKKKRDGKEIKWVHYSTCEKVFSDCKTLPASILDSWDDNKIKLLLELYMQNLSRFRSPNYLQKYIWKDIASQIGTTEYICYHKFKNLKRTYFNWLQRSRQSGKPIKWPYQQYFEKIYYDYTPTACAWNSTKTRQLVDTYIQMADKFRDPRFHKKDLWKQVSMVVEEGPHSCDKKFRNLKQTYLKLKMRADSGHPVTKWRYYKDFESIYSPHTYWGIVNGTPDAEAEDYVKQLLQFYIENKDQFRNPMKKKKHVWRLLAPKIGLSSEGCDRKFRNLKQTYIKLAEKKQNTGKAIRWPYFSYFEKIYDEQVPYKNICRSNIDEVAVSEVKKVISQLQDRKDDDKFERLVSAVEECNSIQRERNIILQALLDRK